MIQVDIFSEEFMMITLRNLLPLLLLALTSVRL
jgi:hypothetical protein